MTSGLLRALFRAAAALTLLCGAIGIARQRREQAAVRAGRAAPVHAATRTVGPPREGAIAATLATWVPARPSTAAGRLLAAAWAAPLTAAGIALAVGSGSRPAWDPDRGAWIAIGVNGGLSRVLTVAPAGANAVGQVILVRGDAPSDLLLAHEATHVRQVERLGPLVLPLYTWWWARHGYRLHPLERGAREGARRWRNANAPGLSPGRHA